MSNRKRCYICGKDLDKRDGLWMYESTILRKVFVCKDDYTCSNPYFKKPLRTVKFRQTSLSY